MRISVITPRFTIAGVPLAQIRFARALAAHGHAVDLVIGRIDPDYKFPELRDVRVVHLDRARVREMVVDLWRYLRQHKPEIVFSAEDHLNGAVLLAAILSGSRAKISCSSRVTPFDTYSTVPFSKRWFLKWFMRAVMWRANVLTCVSKDMVLQYQQVFSAPRHVCAYNIVKDEQSVARMQEAVNHPWFTDKEHPILVAAGSLVPWKGFDDLIKSMLIVSKNSNARLAILGEGPAKPQLEALIAELELSSVVQLLGYQENPLKFFSNASVFVLSSHVEGLPNVLIEAMMCGCTPVATDCPTGPKEVLQDGKYGYLVEMRNSSALAEGILQALKSPIDAGVLEEATHDFEASRVLDRHFRLLGITAGK